MKQRFKEAICAAVCGFLLTWGVILSVCSLMLLFAAALGHIPAWHAAVTAFAAMISLTLSHLAL